MKKNEEKKSENTQEEKRREKISRLIKEFDRIFKSEKDCQEKINQLLYPDGNYICRECKSRNVERKYGDRNIKCLSCKKVTSLTTNTFFHKTKSARSYLAPIWMMEKGMILNASEIGRVSNVVNSTGQHILKKITYVIKNKMSEVAPYLNSDQLINTICKRSKETRRRMPPDSEISDARNNRHNHNRRQKDTITYKATFIQKNSEINQLTEDRKPLTLANQIETMILKNLSDTPLQLEVLQERMKISASELLPALTVLELNEAISRLPGEYFTKRSQKAPMISDEGIKRSDTANSGISKRKLIKTIKLIKARFHGISRKYLQFYLAALWVYVDRKRWKTDEILKACCKTGEISHHSIYDYVSPYAVKAMIIP